MGKSDEEGNMNWTFGSLTREKDEEEEEAGEDNNVGSKTRIF